MFIKKITTLKNLGRYRQGGVSGGEYQKYTMFYAGNGRGKTTLCAAFRSMMTNDPNEIIRRRTFGSTTPQDVQFLLDSGVARFTGGAWVNGSSDIAIFDQRYINENVHGGHQVDVEQRRNFYRVVVGPAGVALANELDDLDIKIAAKNADITSERKVLSQHVPAGMTLDAFTKLPNDSDLDEKIEKALKAVSAAEATGAIAAKPNFVAPSLPKAPDGLSTLLAKGLEGISADAAALVQNQIARHNFHDGGEEWLSEGLSHIEHSSCPFCGVSVEGNPLIDAYQGYFSEAYTALKELFEAFAKANDNSLGPIAAQRLTQSFRDAATNAEFWRQYTELEYELPTAVDRIVTELGAVHAAARELLTAKISAPLEVIPLSEAYNAAAATWMATCEELNGACEAMIAARPMVEAVKAEAGTANKATLEAQLARLRAIMKRHSEPFLSLAAGFDSLGTERQDLLNKKDAKKEELDTYDAAIFASYQEDINKILARFNAGFRLAECGKNYVGKTPQSQYCLRFDTHDVDVSRSGNDVPTFDSVMSAGDKSTFALAFFLAQLDRDPSIASKVVIFDDPFTSLDDFRREMTAKAIVRIGEKASQVIVFSHDKYFLDAVRKKVHGAGCLPMQISATTGNSSIEPWDIEREILEGYLEDHMTLNEYVSGAGGDARDMRTKMRPLLEKYIRYRFPNVWGPNDWLGDMLNVIRGNPNHALADVYSELDDINEYTAPFHHDPSSHHNDDEVLAHVRRTLAIVGGC